MSKWAVMTLGFRGLGLQRCIVSGFRLFGVWGLELRLLGFTVLGFRVSGLGLIIWTWPYVGLAFQKTIFRARQ